MKYKDVIFKIELWILNFWLLIVVYRPVFLVLLVRTCYSISYRYYVTNLSFLLKDSLLS